MRPASPRLLASTALLLVASLAGNTYLLLRSHPAVAPQHASLNRPAAAPGDLRCAAELEAWRRTTSGLALGIWETARTETADASAPASPSLPREPSDRRSSVCRIAREKMREQWAEQRDAVTASVVRELPDTEKQRTDAQRNAEHAAGTLGLQGRTRQACEEDLVDLRQKRMAELAVATQVTPVDWSRILEGAKSMFDDEDALVQRELGDDALQRYVDAERDGRITALSIAAT